MKRRNISIKKWNLSLIAGVLFFIAMSNVSWGQEFRCTDDMRAAYEAFTTLKMGEGRKWVEKIKREDPTNFLIYHVENYEDFLRCFIHEEDQEYDQLKGNKKKRLDKIKNGNPNSPWFRFCQAEVLLQWSFVELKFKKYVSALSGMNEAIGLLEENDRLYPQFIANKKSLSALHAMVGTIPKKYRAMLSWISHFEGTINQGYQEIKEVEVNMKDDFLFFDEVHVIKALIETHLLNAPKMAYQTVQVFEEKQSGHPLLNFISANIHHRSGYNDEAIRILENHEIASGEMPFYYLDYLRGVYKLHRLDADSDRYIRRYLNYFEGKNYIKEAYQKLAWHAWAIEGDSLEYKRNMTYCIKRGDAIIDEDKQALSESKKKTIPNRFLLQARLLSDGAYYSKALNLLEAVENEARTDNEELEYSYRRGRIAMLAGNLNEATTLFQSLHSRDYNSSLYYQMASHLYLGQVFEKRGEWHLAQVQFQKVLSLKSEQYEDSLKQKAKAGLLRIQGK